MKILNHICLYLLKNISIVAKSERLSFAFYGTSPFKTFRNDILSSEIKNTNFISHDYEHGYCATDIVMIDNEDEKKISLQFDSNLYYKLLTLD